MGKANPSEKAIDRLPLSLGLPHFLATDLVNRWSLFRNRSMSSASAEGFCSQLHTLNISWAAFHYFLFKVEDEFIAAADGLAEWREIIEPSAHNLVYQSLWHWFNNLMASVPDTLGNTPEGSKVSDDEMPLWDKWQYGWQASADKHLTRDDFLPHFDILVRQSNALLIPGNGEMTALKAKLRQEVYRAIANRGGSRNRYPVDENPPLENSWDEFSGVDLEREEIASLKLSLAERQVLEVLSQSVQRIPTRVVLAALAAKHGCASEGTVKATLANLGRRELVDNRQDQQPKGYALTALGRAALNWYIPE